MKLMVSWGRQTSKQAILHSMKGIIIEVRMLREHIRGMTKMGVGGQGRSDNFSRDPKAELKLGKLCPCVLWGGG